METVSEKLNETRRHVLAFVRSLERRLLTRVDGALRAVDERVKMRLARLTRKPRPGRARRKKAVHAAPLAA
jgi:hypothetical protein